MANRFKPCAVKDCSGNSHRDAVGAKGYCLNHYRRNKKYGDPLAGGTPHGALLQFINEVALKHEGDECLIWPFAISPNGYGSVYANGKTMRTHRYVCSLVNGEPPFENADTAHACGNRACVNPRHLRWATRVENMADKDMHGTAQRGTKGTLAKLTEEQVLEIHRLKGKKKQRQIAAQFGMSEASISRILSGNAYAEQARRFIARDLLECSIEELGGAA